MFEKKWALLPVIGGLEYDLMFRYQTKSGAERYAKWATKKNHRSDVPVSYRVCRVSDLPQAVDILSEGL